VLWLCRTSLAISPGASAELTASRKCEKYANLPNCYMFQPIAFEKLGTLNSSAIALISAIELKISTKSYDLRESTFLFQRLAIHFQRFKFVLLRESFVCDLDK